MGDGKHFMVFPVRSGRLLNYVGFVPTESQTIESWSAVGDRDELAASFAGWDPRVVGLLEKVESCFWWGLYDRTPLGFMDQGTSRASGRRRACDAPACRPGRQSGDRRRRCACGLAGGPRSSQRLPMRLRRYEAFRRERTGIVQARSAAERSSLRFTVPKAWKQRDREIATSAEFRKWLYDYDVDKAAIAYRQENLESSSADVSSVFDPLSFP